MGPFCPDISFCISGCLSTLSILAVQKQQVATCAEISNRAIFAMNTLSFLKLVCLTYRKCTNKPFGLKGSKCFTLHARVISPLYTKCTTDSGA